MGYHAMTDIENYHQQLAIDEFALQLAKDVGTERAKNLLLVASARLAVEEPRADEHTIPDWLVDATHVALYLQDSTHPKGHHGK